jgi:hypothetical protein
MATLDIVLGLLLVIGPVVLLAAGLGLSHFMPSKRRVIGIILVLIGGLGAVIFGIGFIMSIVQETVAAMIGLGLLFAVELVTLVVGVIIIRKKSPIAPAITAEKPANQ